MVSFMMNPFTTDIPDCPVTYACEPISGPGNAICDFMSTDGSMASLDPTTGNYGFMTTDMATFPPGQYIIQIYGWAGDPSLSNSPFVELTINLTDPNGCGTAQVIPTA